MTDTEKQTIASEETQQPNTKKEAPIVPYPRFPLVRSGFWIAWVFPICTAAATCVTPYENGHNPAFYCWLLLTVILTCAAGIDSKKRKGLAKDDIRMIQTEMSQYVNNPKYVLLDLSNVRHFPDVTSFSIRYIARKEPGVLDKWLANPGSVSDTYAMQDIISGGLDGQPDKAQAILDALHQLKQSKAEKKRAQRALGANEMQMAEIDDDNEMPTADDVLDIPYDLRRRLERHARRIADDAPVKRR